MVIVRSGRLFGFVSVPWWTGQLKLAELLKWDDGHLNERVLGQPHDQVLSYWHQVAAGYLRSSHALINDYAHGSGGHPSHTALQD